MKEIDASIDRGEGGEEKEKERKEKESVYTEIFSILNKNGLGKGKTDLKTISTTIQFSFTIIIYTLYSFIYTYFLFKSHILLQSTLRGNSRNSWDKTHLTGLSFLSDFS